MEPLTELLQRGHVPFGQDLNIAIREVLRIPRDTES